MNLNDLLVNSTRSRSTYSMRIILMTPIISIGIKAGYGLLVPLGVAYLAGVLKKNGHSIKIIDPQVQKINFSELQKVIKSFKPDIIGITVMTPQADDAYNTARFIKSNFPTIKIVFGGAHMICYPEKAMKKCKAIDVGVYVEAENIIVELFTKLIENKSLREISGIIYYENSKLIKISSNNTAVNLEGLPFPARELFNLECYKPEPFELNRLPATNLIVSRGCTYSKCTFCHRSSKLKRPYRIQSPQKTINEIKDIISCYKIYDYVFYDDDLLSNRRWIREFTGLLNGEKIQIKWVCRGRTGGIDYETLNMAKGAGCWSVEIGFESGVQELLDGINKGTTVENGRKVAAWCKELNIQIIGTFMLALPGETPKMADQTIKYAIKLDCDYAAFIPFHPFPGTRAYKECKSCGQLNSEIYKGRKAGIRYVPSISFVPDGYESAKAVEKKIEAAYKQFYFRKKYILKHIKRLRSPHDLGKYFLGIKLLLKLV